MSNLIIGVNSFLGQNLKQKLLGIKEEVYDISFRPNNLEAFKKEFIELINSNEISCIYICGGSQLTSDKIADISDLVESNIYLPTFIAAFINENSLNISLFHFGSSWQYDDKNDFSPFNLYASTKHSAESMLEHYAMEGVKIASIRLFDTYGPEDSRPKLVNLIANAVKNNEHLNMSSGEQVINLVHIHDVIEGIMATRKMLEQSFDEKLVKVSLKSLEPIRVKNIISVFEKIKSKDLKNLFTLGHYPYRKRERFKLSELNDFPDNWSPKISLEDGLKDLL